MGIYKREITDDKVISDFEILHEQYKDIENKLDSQEKWLYEKCQVINNKLDSQERALGRIWRQLYSIMSLKIYIPITAGVVIGGLVIAPILRALIK